MKIYVLPVSGGGFVVQIALLKILNESAENFKPDLVLGSSGGNVSAYLSMVGDWNYSSIVKNSYLISSKLFVESWTPSFLPSWLALPLTKSVYRSSDGVKNLFKKIYNQDSVTNTEIWSGTYNKDTQKAAFFCNKSLENAFLKDLNVNEHIYDREESVYLNGNVEEIADACYASASIPYITSGVKIKGEKHVDGGVAYASPLVPLKNKIINTIRKQKSDELIQIIHFSSYNMDEVFSDNLYSNSIGLLIHSTLLHDRDACVSFLREFGTISEIPEIYNRGNKEILSRLINELKDSSYVMMLSPNVSMSISVTNFDSTEVIDIINKTEKDFRIFVWKLIKRHN